MANLSPEDTDQVASFPIFSHLPAELRQLIWLMSFSPRILNLKVYVETIPEDSTEIEDSFEIEDSPKRVLRIADEDLDDIPPSYAKFACKPAPSVPAALHVCRESRQVALLHYEPAFGGVNLQPREDTAAVEAWRASGLGEKKILVDFARDLVVVEGRYDQYIINPDRKPAHPLHRLTTYAPEETRKIQRLAVTERWYAASHPGRRGMGYFRDYFDGATGLHKGSAMTYLRKFLRHFKAIRELEIYEIGDLSVPVDASGWRTTDDEFLSADMEVFRAKLLDILVREKENASDGWTADLPSLTVRKGPQGRWDGTFVT